MIPISTKHKFNKILNEIYCNLEYINIQINIGNNYIEDLKTIEKIFLKISCVESFNYDNVINNKMISVIICLLLDIIKNDSFRQIYFETFLSFNKNYYNTINSYTNEIINNILKLKTIYSNSEKCIQIDETIKKLAIKYSLLVLYDMYVKYYNINPDVNIYKYIYKNLYNKQNIKIKKSVLVRSKQNIKIKKSILVRSKKNIKIKKYVLVRSKKNKSTKINYINNYLYILIGIFIGVSITKFVLKF